MLALKSHHYQEGSASKLYLKRIYITLSPVHNINEAQKKSSFFFFFSFFLCLEDCRLRCFVVHDTKRRQILHCRWFCLKKKKRNKEKKSTIQNLRFVSRPSIWFTIMKPFFFVICKETFQSLITWDITSSDQSQGAKSGTPMYSIFMHVFIMDEHHAFTSSPQN